MPQGKDSEHADEFGPGDIGAVAKLKETHAGDVLAAQDAEIPLALPAMPRPVMAFAIEAKAKGDEEKMGQALRRLQEEDPTIDFHRDEQTGEQILAGITQIHVEVIVERMKERFGAEVELHQPHVPYREAIKGSAKAHARYKKQTGGRGQFADCHIEIEPLAHGEGFEFVNAIKGGVIPAGSSRPWRRACARRCEPAWWPASPCRTCGSGCSTASTTPSTRRRWRSRSPGRWRSRTPWRARRRC